MTTLDFLNRVGNIKEYSRKSRVLLFAYYLRQYQGLTEFATAYIRTSFREALLKIPSDLSRLLEDLSKDRNSPLMKGSRTARYALSIPGLNKMEARLAAKEQPESEVDFLVS